MNLEASTQHCREGISFMFSSSGLPSVLHPYPKIKFSFLVTGSMLSEPLVFTAGRPNPSEEQALEGSQVTVFSRVWNSPQPQILSTAQFWKMLLTLATQFHLPQRQGYRVDGELGDSFKPPEDCLSPHKEADVLGHRECGPLSICSPQHSLWSKPRRVFILFQLGRREQPIGIS